MKIFYKRLLILGIALGVFCSLFVFTAGQTQMTARQMRNSVLDADIYKIIYKPESNSMRSISLDTSKQIQEALPDDVLSDMVAPSFNTLVSYKEDFLSSWVTGTGCNYGTVMKLDFVQGRYFTEEEQEGRSKVCIVKDSLYGQLGDNLARFITIKNEVYEIIGVFKDNIASSQEFFEADVYLPITTFSEEILKAPEATGLIYEIVFNKGSYTKDQIMEGVKRAEIGMFDTSKLEMMLYHENWFATFEEFARMFLVVFLISLFILVISAFNIVHIVTASIIDREREIGLRTALGATTRHIVGQIGLEITECSLKGGLLGVALSGIVNTIINYKFKQLEFSFNIITIGAGLLLATLAGLIASVIPARKAAKLDPLAALREE